ncbi:target of rapamycin isoform 1 [Bombyx mori]|uniref:non-specific serine/threonine protein kinase n=1 Tax=Bombyx mori TaxID=7091 RepID=D6N9W5_BOMMO|nr:target of rapamycin isoform 1 [Bombyx mori]ADB91963.1 target of rapamycin isoform 1 [Bombyx mori]
MKISDKGDNMTNHQVLELISGLKSRHSETRHRAVRELLHFAKTELREMSQDSLTQILDDFNQQIHDMTTSYDNNDKKAGILTIVCLIGGDTETTKTRTIRYANYLRNVFPSTDLNLLELGAKTMGRLASSLGIKRGEYVETEIKRCFEWLAEERNEGKRLSAVLILRELAISMPSYFFQQINGFFNHIMRALRDPKDQIREAAAKVLRAAFAVTSQREQPEQSNKAHWYIQCYEEAETSFGDHAIRERGLNRDDHVHGALLILNELLRCSNAAWEKKYTSLMQKLDPDLDSHDEMSSLSPKIQGSWSLSHYSDEKNQPLIFESSICKKLIEDNCEKISADVMAQQISRAHNVHQMLLLLIPRLAAFNKETFARRHLKSTINHLITFLRGREKEKAMAFTTLGLVCVAMESDVQQYLSRIIDIIKLTLPIKETQKKRNGSETPLFHCVTLLGFAMKENVANEVRELLDSMCLTGLSPQLTTCFKELSNNLPSLKKDITDKLLNMLSLILRKKPYVSTNENHKGVFTTALLAEPHDANKLVLALRTLGSFDFEWNNTLMSFIRRCTDHYLLCDHHDIRLEAVKTAARLLTKAVERCAQINSRTLNLMIDESIGKILSVGRSDFDHEISYRVLEVFMNPVFDRYLAVEEHLNCLFVSINDSNSEVGELALCIFARLSNLSPSYTTPILRQLYVQILIDLQHSESPRNKEKALQMINNIISHAPTITRQFVDTILNVLIPKLKEKDSNSTMISTVLKAIGDLAEVNGGGHALNKWLTELISTQIEILADPNQIEKRSVALWSFGQVVSATGHVVAPYMEYSKLMDLLLNFLKTEQQLRERRETVRILGLLGALDPYKYKVNQGLIDFQTVSTLIPIREPSVDSFESNISEMLVNMSPLVLDEFYPAIVVTSLMIMLRDPTLAHHHPSVVHSVTFIFQSLGIKCVPYISRVAPTLLHVIRTTENSNFREILLTQLAQLISVVKIHIRNYLEDIFDMIREYWTPNSHLQATLIMLVEHITVAIGTEFKIYLRKILPNILRVLKHDTSKDRFLTEKLLITIQKFENNLDDVLLSVVPAITALFDGRNIPFAISKLAMETIEHLSVHLCVKQYSATIIQALVKVLDNNASLRQTAMNTLSALIVQMGREYIDYIPSMERILSKHKIQCPNYIVLVTRLQLISTLASDDDYLDETRSRLRNQKNEMVRCTTEMQPIQKVTLNVHNLRKCWSVHNIVSKEDWMEWLRLLSVGFLTESNSPAIRACSTLAHNNPQLASDLFNAAFMSCWTELDESSRKDLVAALERALTVPDLPELALAVLNLAEFMEHCEKSLLPISIKLLGDTAISCRAYAKALYYKEEEYKKNPCTKVIEALIHINNKLQRKEATNGLLEKAVSENKNGENAINNHVHWYEKLNNWDQALELYTIALESQPNDEASKLGTMRCLEAMGEWKRLYSMTHDQWDNMDEEFRNKSAKMAAAASWGLQEWYSMKKYVELIPESTQDGAFYRAIINIQDGQWAESRHYIDLARSLIDVELTAVVGESYQRAYGTLVNAQLLTELEEIITYKLIEERRSTIRKTWWTRLQGGQRLVEDWRKILQVRSLVMSPREDFQTWLKFASLCRKTGAINQAHKIVISVLGSDPISNPDVMLHVQDPRIILAYSKNLWDVGNKRYAHDVLQRFVDSTEPENEEHCRLLARCHLKLGSWCEAIHEINELSIPEILRNYATATILAPEWYKACHAWACMNFETVLFYKQQDNTSESSVTGGTGEKKVARTDFINAYTIPAIEGFFKSISLSNGNALQDTLRLLTLWFDHGHHPAIYDAIFEGIRQIDIKIWLQVIPQLIARIDSPRNLVAKLVHILLIDIGKSHPQALVYPLTVATKSSFVTRKDAANYVLKTMCIHAQNLVNEAAIISEELIKVAILWHDQVYIALDEASRFCFSEKDYKRMFKTLDKMHAMLDTPPETLKEVSFLQMYGRDLQEARRWCELYKESNEERYLNEAWDLYYHVVRRIQAQFRSLTSLELQYVSKRLHSCKDLELAVPGSYVPNQKIINISYIHSNLQVIKSKQRPRRLTIQGSDGKQYMFLLKGHEDLRQDERVMQLFGLVNALLRADADTYRHDLAIQRYAVIPLSPNSGLIGWVPHCDTLYNLISEFRDKKTNKTALNTEQQIMLRMASDYQKLMLKHKVEVFEYALSQTPGNDLARLLWLKSPSSEVWFERRTNYTRSLAVMSMVGYILGLGDRHPSNIMLHKVTGKVLHIDFGDCFEVTQTREKFPEKIPFRLTRMLINAMEVTGIEGTYRFTCESVMHVLHKHRDSVMAVLEAFVYDPLLNWRLVDNDHHSITESSFSSDIDYSYTLPNRSRNHLLYESPEIPPEANLNKRAVAILNRIRDRLTGRDFPNVESIVSVPQQVELLVKQATSNENLCQCYIGWCPFW